MPTVTLTISEEDKAGFSRFPWVNWSELAREGIEREMQLQEDREEFTRIVSKSKLTEADAMALADKVKKSMHERYKKLYKGLR